MLSAKRSDAVFQVHLIMNDRRSSMFDGVKVFSCTLHRERDQLGEVVSAWLRNHSDLEIVDINVRQSSDSEFHCISVVVFYRASG